MSSTGQPSGWRSFIPISFWLTSYEKDGPRGLADTTETEEGHDADEAGD